MRKTATTLIVLCIAHLMTTSFSYAGKFEIGPIDGWIKKIELRTSCEFPDASLADGVCYLLVDRQYRIAKDVFELYSHYAQKIVNTAGAETFSQINIDYNPSYESVVFHEVHIRRNGDVFNRLNRSRISLFQREKRLEHRLYDGTHTLHLILDDVRVGDVVEYAFTIKGINPALEGAFFDDVGLRWQVPVQKFYYRLVTSSDIQLQSKMFFTQLKPEVTQHASGKEYELMQDHVLPLEVEPNIPAWYNPYPRIQFSNLDNWGSVARWGAKLYPITDRLSADLKAEIRKIARSSSDSGQRVAAALRFVQDEIRYLGIEVGEGSFVPSHPSLVLKRRFGDCKDKSYLLVTLLHKLDVEAYPALVSTVWLHRLDEMLPSPLVFNHVIVAAKLRDELVWMDPAQASQNGTLEDMYLPDYGRALILEDGVTRLRVIEPRVIQGPTKIVKERFDLTAGAENGVSFGVETTLIGENAVRFVERLKTTSRDELKRQYLEFYRTDYSGITPVAPLEMDVSDDENRVVIREEYRIDEFWSFIKERQEDQGVIFPREIYLMVEPGTVQARKMPLAVSYPVDHMHEIRIKLPENMSMRMVDERIEDATFFFHHEVTREDNVFSLVYRYKTKRDHVPAREAKDHLTKRAQLVSKLGYTFHNSDESKISWSQHLKKHLMPVAMMMIVTAFCLVAGIYVALRIYKYDPEPRLIAMHSEIAPGIKGWLILFSISVVIAPIYAFSGLFELLKAFSFVNLSYFVDHASDGYNAFWAPVVLFETAANLLNLIFSILLLILFFKKRQIFPLVFVGSRVVWLAIVVGDNLVAESLLDIGIESNDINALIRDVVYTLVWSAYLWLSQRASVTFRQRLTSKDRVVVDPHLIAQG